MRQPRLLSFCLATTALLGCEALLGLRDEYVDVTDAGPAVEGGPTPDATTEASADAPPLDDATLPSTCADGTQNGTETDADCGGTCARGCADGKGCKVDADCASGNCNAAVCAPWATLFVPAGDGVITLTGVAAHASGTLCVSGSTSGTLITPPSAEGASETGASSFVARVGAKGSVLWLRKLTSTGSVGSAAVAVDAAGDCYLAGQASGDLQMPGGGPALSLASPTGFVARLAASDGATRWAVPLAPWSSPTGLAVRASDGVVIAAGGGDMAEGFLQSFAADGDGGTLLKIGQRNTRALAMTLDPKTGDAIAVGIYSEALSVTPFNLAAPTPYAVYLLRANFDGGVKTTALVDLGRGWEPSQALAPEGDGGVYGAGGHTADFDASCARPTQLEPTDGGVYEPLMMRLTPSSQCEWVSRTFVDGGVNRDVEYHEAVTLDSNGTIVATGRTQSAQLSFGGPVHATLASQGVHVPYFVRYRAADGVFVGSSTGVTLQGSRALREGRIASLPKGGVAFTTSYAGSLTINGLALQNTSGAGATGALVGFSGPP